MDNLMKLYRKERVNDYFKNYAIMQIKVAYRILEYLEPDEYFPPKNIDESTMELFLQREVGKAVSRIFDEISFKCGCSSGYEDIEREANAFASEVLEDYFAKIKKDKLSEKEQLLIRLGELDKELDNA